MADALLSLEQVRVQYGAFLAVDDVSFDVHAGELIGLVGPNGAGKTTTLRAAVGLLPLSTGRVRVMGADLLAGQAHVRQHLGFAPDNPAVYDALTVEDYLDFIGRCYNLPPRFRAERIDYWLDQVWLNEKRKAKVSALSRGMKQRLTVARTLLPDPHVILLDEPAAGLDPAGRVQFRRLLASLRDQGKALIVSSHILADLAEVSTHVAIMERGRIVTYGTVAEVTGQASEHRCRYRIVLARAMPGIQRRLADFDGLTDVQVDGDRITLEYDSDRNAAARLLAQLVQAELPIAAFQPEEADLEQVYLRAGIAQVD